MVSGLKTLVIASSFQVRQNAKPSKSTVRGLCLLRVAQRTNAITSGQYFFGNNLLDFMRARLYTRPSMTEKEVARWELNLRP
jgi:hypothetical protein